MHSTYQGHQFLEAKKISELIQRNKFEKTGIEESIEVFKLYPFLKNDLNNFNPFIKDMKNSRLTSLWWSGKNKITDWHTDSLDLILCQITGTKTIRLLSPDLEEVIKPIDQPILFKFLCSIGIDPYTALEESQENQFAHHKSFTDEKLKDVIEFKLNPGDSIFIPKGWWHSTISHSETIAVNFEVLHPEELII